MAGLGINSEYKNCLSLISLVSFFKELVTPHRMMNRNLNWNDRKRNLLKCNSGN